MTCGLQGMRYASVCDGIGAVHVAWRPLGWSCAWTAEIDPFCCAVVEARFPGTPNLGNSMAVPVMRWIGRRIELIEDILRETRTEPAA